MLTKWKTSFLTAATIVTLGFTTSCGKGEGTNIQIAGLKGPTVSLLQDNMILKVQVQKWLFQSRLKIS